MRVVKDAEERRNEILDVAERLFATKGFDGTSTNDILEEIGIARGTLYYHFKSKEDILDAMIDRITMRLLGDAAKIANQTEIPVLQRITMTMMAMKVENDLGYEVMEQVHRPQNALLAQKMQEKLLDGINPIITGLIEEGIRQGLCNTEHPTEAVEMMMLYAEITFDSQVERTRKVWAQKVAAFIYNVERLLGMEEGSLQEYVAPIFQNGGQQKK